MEITFAKYLLLSLTIYITYSKLLGVSLTKKKLILACIKSFIIAGIVLITIKYAQPLNIFMLFLSFVIFNFHKSLHTTVTTTSIAIGLSYMGLFLSTLLTIPILLIIQLITDNKYNLNLPAVIFALLIDMIIMLLFFNRKKFQNGITYLKENAAGDFAAILSFIVIWLATAISYLSSTNKNPPIWYFLLILLIFIVGIIITSWIKNTLSTHYMYKHTLREKVDLCNELEASQKEIERLSEIIHTDSKLVFAMEKSVFSYILSEEITDKEKAFAYLKSLQSLSDYRRSLIKKNDSSDLTDSNPITKTGLINIDAVLTYMAERANRRNITFMFTPTIETGKLVNTLEMDIATILADALDNAIIAVDLATNKVINTTLHISDNCISITIADSGSAFSEDVLSTLGVEKKTTHKNSGGTGTGLITISNITKKYKGTFEINTHVDLPYTKSIIIKLYF